MMCSNGMAKLCLNFSYQFHFHHGWMTFSTHGIPNRIMVANDSDIGSAEVSNRGTVILDESDPRTVIERLPNTIFPVMIRFSAGKSTNGDRTHEEYHTPDYPVDVRIPQEHIFQNRRFISITPQSDLLEMRLHGDRGSSLSLYPNYSGS